MDIALTLIAFYVLVAERCFYWATHADIETNRGLWGHMAIAWIVYWPLVFLIRFVGQ